jgi:proton-dependent oligopeptide transporter, POT family
VRVTIYYVVLQLPRDECLTTVQSFITTSNCRFLARNNIKLATGYKFALGCAIGACAILWSLLVEVMIHKEYARSGERISVLWQAPSYILTGAGEIFSISTAYEVAFTASPPNKKAFACAFNLFCIGGIPNMLSLALYRMCQHWFQNNNGSGNIGRIKDYSEAHVGKYFCVLLGIVMFGVVVNMLHPVRQWIAFVENRAAKAASGSSAANTAKVQKRKSYSTSETGEMETEPLLKAQKHIKYLEEGSEGGIYRMNTMKAEFSRRAKK